MPVLLRVHFITTKRISCKMLLILT